FRLAERWVTSLGTSQYWIHTPGMRRAPAGRFLTSRSCCMDTASSRSTSTSAAWPGSVTANGPRPSPALDKLLNRATTTSHGASSCGPIFTIPDTSLPQRAESYFVEYAVAGTITDGDSNSRVKLPHTARAMAHLLAEGTSREAEATGRELARLP